MWRKIGSKIIVLKGGYINMDVKIFGKSMFKRKMVVLPIIIVFFLGWLSFSFYIYTNQILFLSIEGPIYDFQSTTLALYQGKLDRNVKAVVLYLNTPGGDAYSCIEIGNYVKDLATVKPVIAVMGAQCASGGYYIASFATHIFTHENTITGGIGVIATWVDLSEYYEKEGIQIWIWNTGSEKDIGAEWRSPTQAENTSIWAEVIYIFNELIKDIKVNRPNLTPQDIDAIKTGRVFLGDVAVQMGLADQIGNIFNAVEKAASIKGLWKYILVTPYMDDKQKFFKAIF